ncbi:MAG TPA: hypothetical protein DDW49_08550 [Deltaproteobacteria bacterium]|nr:MAG: hypothetical protein A2048_05510 [Deltaproteobacteria bacterium GWA2_45_12]HBF13414.1 hypothetical protein [Deltaproteobacteria bacterium]
MSGGGDAVNQYSVQQAHEMAYGQIQAAHEQGKWTFFGMREQSRAVIEQMKMEVQIRREELTAQKDVQIEALRVREKEANLEFLARMREAEVQAIRNEGYAEAAVVSAKAQFLKGEAAVENAETKRLRTELRYGGYNYDGNNSDNPLDGSGFREEIS